MARARRTNKLKGQDKSTCSREREAYWRQRMIEWEGSGLTQAKFCRRQSLSLSTFRWWRSELKRRGRADTKGRGEEETKAAFLPVEVIASPDRSGSREREPLEIVLGNGRRIRVGCDFDAEALERVVGVLERVAC